MPAAPETPGVRPAEPPVLEVVDLSIGLPRGGDRDTAVRRVSFAVGPGEVLCLVGESGSGKSVIAQAVMGLLPKGLPVQSGRILLQGEDITRATPQRLRELRATRMSMIFQEPMTALNPVMTCGDQIDEVLAQHTPLSAAERRAKVLSIVREVLLPEPERIVASYPHQLSGGQRQRIVIAMALVLDPVLLIADEPTTALDVTTQAQILKLVLELQQRHGAGVLFITHDFGVVAEVAHRVAVLRLGDMVEIGLPQRTQPRLGRGRLHALLRRRADTAEGQHRPDQHETRLRSDGRQEIPHASGCFLRPRARREGAQPTR